MAVGGGQLGGLGTMCVVLGSPTTATGEGTTMFATAAAAFVGVEEMEETTEETTGETMGETMGVGTATPQKMTTTTTTMMMMIMMGERMAAKARGEMKGMGERKRKRKRKRQSSTPAWPKSWKWGFPSTGASGH